jgi:hypothetical protein
MIVRIEERDLSNLTEAARALDPFCAFARSPKGWHEQKSRKHQEENRPKATVGDHSPSLAAIPGGGMERIAVIQGHFDSYYLRRNRSGDPGRWLGFDEVPA